MFFSVQGQVAERKAIWGSLAETRAQNILNGPTFHVFLPFNALKPVNMHQDAGALKALCLNMWLFVNRLDEMGQS